MTTCLFASDIHGKIERYQSLFAAILEKRPDAVFLGGDLLPPAIASMAKSTNFIEDFIGTYLVGQFAAIQEILGEKYPEIFVIMGNDDGRYEEHAIFSGERAGLWHYAHNRKFSYRGYDIYGYAYIPPTPFLLKDWERYDVSIYVDPGCVSPEQGVRTIGVSEYDVKYMTIAEDLDSLTIGDNLDRAVFLFHAPPYNTKLDLAALAGKMIDHVPLDPHVGSIAIRRFIESRQPFLTLHGHVHESASLTGCWQDRIGNTLLFSAAHDGPELSLIEFQLENTETATRILI